MNTFQFSVNSFKINLCIYIGLQTFSIYILGSSPKGLLPKEDFLGFEFLSAVEGKYDLYYTWNLTKQQLTDFSDGKILLLNLSKDIENHIKRMENILCFI